MTDHLIEIDPKRNYVGDVHAIIAAHGQRNWPVDALVALSANYLPASTKMLETGRAGVQDWTDAAKQAAAKLYLDLVNEGVDPHAGDIAALQDFLEQDQAKQGEKVIIFFSGGSDLDPLSARPQRPARTVQQQACVLLSMLS